MEACKVMGGSSKRSSDSGILPSISVCATKRATDATHDAQERATCSHIDSQGICPLADCYPMTTEVVHMCKPVCTQSNHNCKLSC